MRIQLGKEDGEFRILLPLLTVSVAAVIFYQLFFAEPKPPIPRSSLTGCFVAKNAPMLHFDGQRLRVGQNGVSPVDYSIEWTKTGLEVQTQPSIHLVGDTGKGWRFAAGPGPWNNIIMPKHIVNGKRYGVTDMDQMEFLEVRGQDEHLSPGQDIPIVHFRRVNEAACH